MHVIDINIRHDPDQVSRLKKYGIKYRMSNIHLYETQFHHLKSCDMFIVFELVDELDTRSILKFQC